MKEILARKMFSSTCQHAHTHACTYTHKPTHTQFGGLDILHVYNKQQLKHRLNLNNLYLVNNRSSGFAIEVTSSVSSQVTMVGVRVMLGLKSIEKAPSFVEVFGRTHTVCGSLSPACC